jgi:alkylation response protein AidB-like acyl-CoA dehydrogenase
MHTADTESFISDFQAELRNVLTTHPEIETTNHLNGLPPDLLAKLLEFNPLSVFIPKENGGLGGKPVHCLSLLEATSYESIAVGLMLGINGSLFIEPVVKYGQTEAKSHVLNTFLTKPSLGGLMITEPNFGTDALSMQTSFCQSGDSYTLQGSKHWGGLTGLADFWLVTARKEKQNRNLARDIDLFIVERSQPDQNITVEEYYHKLGLYLIPYGLNKIDATVPSTAKLIPESSGIKLMMDLLHRSRLRLSGIGLGFIRRMLDEATRHCKQRSIGGRSLLSYDQVQHRISELQAWFTIGSGMCHITSRISGIENNLTSLGLLANSSKAVLTDMMHQGAQSLLQLTGAKGYRRDQIAGRAFADSRPFQIFEGSNDVMYSQVADAVIKEMRIKKQTNLYGFLSKFELTEKISEYYKNTLNFSLDLDSLQRARVTLGEIVAKLITTEFSLELLETGFRKDLVDNTIKVVGNNLVELVSSFSQSQHIDIVEDYQEGSDWKPLFAG